ncbi:MAG: anthranilate synthase component I family protein [Mucilaginibacter polytrichastri]|nr:anthranilate synthase component I family protein [Mucilaginibacter polytrichastri]
MCDAAWLLSHKYHVLRWAAGFRFAVYLDSNTYPDPFGEYELLISVAEKALSLREGSVFDDLSSALANDQWLFGYLGYDLKNETENLSSANADPAGFADACLFHPEKSIALRRDGTIELSGISAEELAAVCSEPFSPPKIAQPIAWQSRFSKEEYVAAVEKIKTSIRRGDIYETNFCKEFFCENQVIDPVTAFAGINERNPSPFSAFFKADDRYALSFSPERFLRRHEDLLISQPIKGTAARFSDAEQDRRSAQQLQNDPKERTENIMITDLVRNDMTRSAKEESVRVSELCGIYTFPSVHQMISTVQGEVQAGLDDAQIIKNMFPMGSMTGAPKIRAMQIMEDVERSRRGLYSGAIGYFSPGGGFDLNVAIRTLIYHAETRYLSYHTGSAITHYCDAEREYDECLLKRRIVDAI